MANYIPADPTLGAFHCPHPGCGTYARQVKGEVTHQPWDEGSTGMSGFTAHRCEMCGGFTLWYTSRMIFPISSDAPFPSDDMPADAVDDFNEARDIYSRSPRGAAALLRLVLQKICIS